MYRGKNQDYYIEGDAKITCLYCIAGEVFPSVFFGDIILEEKGLGILLGLIKR